MPNPTRAQILNAHEALEELKNVALSAADFCGDTEKYLAWKSEIIAALPPKPQPTMDEIEWDELEHRCRVALYHEGNVKVVMLQPSFNCHKIFCLVEPSVGAPYVDELNKSLLTPSNWCYTLTEVQE